MKPDTTKFVPKKVVITLCVGCFLGCIILVGTKMYDNRTYYQSIGDAVWHMLFLFDDATVWAPEYSEDRFKHLQIGLSQSNVLEQLGEPLKTWHQSDREVWWYTSAPPDRNYWFRMVVFDTDRMVTETDRHYFVD